MLEIGQQAPEFCLPNQDNVELLSDESTQMMQDYGAWKLKKNYGKEYMGIVRTTYIIAPDGKIAASWSNVKVRTKRTKNGVVTQRLHTDLVKEKLMELQKEKR